MAPPREPPRRPARRAVHDLGRGRGLVEQPGVRGAEPVRGRAGVERADLPAARPIVRAFFEDASDGLERHLVLPGAERLRAARRRTRWTLWIPHGRWAPSSGPAAPAVAGSCGRREGSAVLRRFSGVGVEEAVVSVEDAIKRVGRPSDGGLPRGAFPSPAAMDLAARPPPHFRGRVSSASESSPSVDVSLSEGPSSGATLPSLPLSACDPRMRVRRDFAVGDRVRVSGRAGTVVGPSRVRLDADGREVESHALEDPLSPGTPAWFEEAAAGPAV